MRYLAIVLTLFIGTALAAPQKFSREVGIPLKEAQAEIAKRHFDAALAKIREAEAVKGKSAFEDYQIKEVKAFALYSKGDLPAAAAVYEDTLESGMMPADQVNDRLKTLTTIYAKLRNDKKTVEYGTRWLQTGGDSSAGAYALVAQSYHQLKDYRNAIKTIDGAIAQATKAGRRPDENWVVLKLNSCYALQDDRCVMLTRQYLVRTFSDPRYWEPLLVTMSGDANTDKVKLAFYRLMLDLNVLKDPADYLEMAQMTMQDFGMPAEADRIIQKSFANKVVAEKDRGRFERAQKMAKERIEEARKLQTELEAKTVRTADEEVQLGCSYLSFEDAAKAVEAIERGIRKGGLKDRDQAQMMLGLAYYRAGQKENAARAFRAIPAKSELATVADLWAIRVQQS